jgi:hypothetical protein
VELWGPRVMSLALLLVYLMCFLGIGLLTNSLPNPVYSPPTADISFVITSGVF